MRALLKDADDEMKESADDVAREIDGYPLALSHAAGYISTHNITCKDFLKIYRDMQLARNLNRSTISLSVIPYYQSNLEDVWTISLKMLSKESRKVLDISAFLDPDQIQAQIIEKVALFTGQPDTEEANRQPDGGGGHMH